MLVVLMLNYGMLPPPPFRDVLDPASEFWEKCARHEKRQTARTIQVLYLCDPCAIRMSAEAMNGRPPIHHGETIQGYCGLCNELLQVTSRFYFVCPFCWNVIVAYQKSFVAAKAVHDYWSSSITPELPHLRLTETEEVYLAPYVRGGKTKKSAASELEYLDFLVEQTSGDEERKPLFHIELKAGPGSIEEMTEFQLDVNDSNDIIGVVNKTRLPAYIFHVQLGHEYSAPTRKTTAIAIWFTDIVTLLQNRAAVRQRRGDQKQAGYYRPSAFQSVDRFLQFLKTNQYEELERTIRASELEMT